MSSKSPIQAGVLSASDAALIDALSRRYRGALVSYFRNRLPAGVDLEDLVQDVFTRLLQRGDAGAIERIDGYLFQIAGSIIADRARRMKRRLASEHEPFEETIHGVEDFSPERVLLGKEAVEAFAQALEELPERTRAVFVLRRFEGLRHREIARRLGVSVSAVEKHMVRAFEHLDARLDRS